MDYIFLLVGFYVLIKGADFFVEGSSSVAKRFNIPSVIIGLTIVACGTSLPELSVSLTAALSGSNDLAIANVVGSNMFNSLVVIGTCAFIAPIVVPDSLMKKEIPFSIFITAILFIGLGGFRYNDLINAGGVFVLPRTCGFLLLAIFIYFIVSSVRQALQQTGNNEEDENIKILSPLASVFYIVAGGVAIMVGGDLVVNAASEIGLSFGMSQSLVGLTIVALGTSLPEFVTSVVAAKKGENEMALGNVIGSNIFNVLLILGVSASISPITVTSQTVMDVFIVFITGIVLYIVAKTQNQIGKREGIFLLVLYLIFFFFILGR